MKKFVLWVAFFPWVAWAQEELGDFEEFQPEKVAPDVRWFGRFDPSLASDVFYDSPRGETSAENVGDARLRLQMGVESNFSKKLKFRFEGWARWRGVSQRSFDRAKANVDVRLGETYADFYGAQVDFRLGNQRVAFGANPMLAPADAFNPVDWSEMSFVGAPEYARLPVLAAKASGSLGKFDWTAVVVPFFQAHRFSVFGQDEGLLQPGAGLRFPLDISPSIEDDLQTLWVATERPTFGDVGLRVKTKVFGTSLGASWLWMNDKLPYLELDAQLTSLLFQASRGDIDATTAQSVQNRLLLGEKLYQARYARRHLLSLEASKLFSGAQLDVDVSWSPNQVFVDSRLRPIFKNSLTWVLGLSQAQESPFFYSLHYLGLWVADVNAPRPLLLLETEGRLPEVRQVVLQALAGNLSYTFANKRLQVSWSFAVELLQRSWMASPKLTWKVSDKTQLWLAAEAFEGSALSPFGYFGRNDQLAAGAEVLLF